MCVAVIPQQHQFTFKDIHDGAARQVEKRKITEKVYG